MTQRTIDLGTQGGADGTSDTIRIAGVKINDDFTELYATSAVQSHIGMVQNEISSTLSNADIDLKPSGTGSILFPGLRFNDNNIEAVGANDDVKIIPNGSGYVMIDGIGFSGTSIHSDDSTVININDNLTIGGDLSASSLVDTGATEFGSTVSVPSGLATLSSLTVSGPSSFVGTTSIDNLTFNDNIIATSSNADLLLTPGGTGVVNVSNLTIDSSINLTDNVIKLTRSNDDLILSSNGTGSVQISKIDMNEGTVDNTVIGATTPAAATFTTLVFSPTNTGSLSTTGLTITDNTITATQSNDDLELEANGVGYVSLNGIVLPHLDGGTGQVLRTDGSGNLSWFTSPILLGVSDIQDARTVVSFEQTTEIDSVTAVGRHDRIESGTAVINHFPPSQYDSAWYLAVNRDDASDEFEVVKHSVAHNNTDAFLSTSVRAQTGTNNHIQSTADISGGLVRLLGTGSSPENSVAFYRIGLGDDDSTGIAGEDESSIVINTDIDSASEVVDTWAKADYRGAKYYISVNNASKTEVSNMEVLVVHDGTTAFVSTYNIVNTGNHDLVTITAAVDGSNVKLSAAGLETNLRLHAYRIILADDEADRSSTNVNVIGEVTVSSASTTLDTFSTGSYQAAHYIVVGYNSTEGAASICEAAVVSDGTTAFISQYGQVSTKGTDQITLSASHASTTTTVSAASTSGGSTVLNAYRVNLARPEGTATATATLDSVSATTYRSAKFNVQTVDVAAGNYEIIEANVTHDGATAYINTWGRASNTAEDLSTLSADISGGQLRLRGTINNTNDHTFTVVRRVIQV